jgi:hypothetical protein
MIDSLILRDQERRGEVGVDPTGCLRLLCPRPHQIRGLMPLTLFLGVIPTSITPNIIELEVGSLTSLSLTCY